MTNAVTHDMSDFQQLQLREFDRVRTLYEKYLEASILLTSPRIHF